MQSGYFIRIKRGIKSSLPIQTCLYIDKDKFEQKVHNIIIAEENSELNIISGCLTEESVKQAIHIGVSEIFVKRGAKLTFTMIHNWNVTITVRPRTVIKVEAGGYFVSNYVCLHPVKDLQMYPVCFLAGENAKASFNSLIYAHPKNKIDVGTRVFLKGKKSRAEVVSKIVCRQAKVINRGHLIGQGEKVKAHLDCGGLIISKKGVIHAIPEIETRLADVDLTHEAFIGKLSYEAVEYLMTRGLSQEKAISMLVTGFLDLSKFNLPKSVEEEISKINFEGCLA